MASGGTTSASNTPSAPWKSRTPALRSISKSHWTTALEPRRKPRASDHCVGGGPTTKWFARRPPGPPPGSSPPDTMDSTTPARPVPTECFLPQLLGALERLLQGGMRQVASALERAAEAKLAVPERTHELPLQRLCRAAGPASSLPVVRLAAATRGGRLAARGTAAAAPIVFTGRLTAAPFGVGSRREEPPPWPGGATVVAALLPPGPLSKTTHCSGRSEDQCRTRI